MGANLNLTIWQDEKDYVKWNKISDAVEYILYDDNSNIAMIKFAANEKREYKPTVVGKHNLKLVAVLKDGKQIKANFKTKEVKMICSYHTWPRSDFRFSEKQIGFTGLDTSLLEKEGDRYIAYYNIDKGWTHKKEEQTDFNQDAYISEFFKNYKAAGMNVLNPFVTAIIRSDVQWETSYLKKVMDKAWYEYGLKMCVLDQSFFEIPTQHEWSREQVKEEIERLLNIEGGAIKGYMHHPGFYGINILDEPMCSKAKDATCINHIQTAGYCCSVLAEIAKRENIECNFSCSLLRYPYMFRGVKGYKEYLEYWVEYSQADFINFDVYLPSVLDNEIRGCEVTSEDFQMTWKCVREVASKHKLKIDAATTAFDFTNGFTYRKVNKRDVLQNVYYALAHESNSLMYFVAFPFVDDGSIIRTIFGFDTKPTEIYGWVKTANENSLVFRSSLQGYKYQKSNAIDNEALQTIKILWKKNNNEYAHLYMNMNSSIDNIPSLVFVYDGEEYLYFKQNGKYERKVSKGESAVWIMPGELLIVFNDKKDILDRATLGNSNKACETLKPHEL